MTNLRNNLVEYLEITTICTSIRIKELICYRNVYKLAWVANMESFLLAWVAVDWLFSTSLISLVAFDKFVLLVWLA